MRFSSFILILIFSLVLLSSYLLINLNTGIITIDFLFVDMHLRTGLALLFFFVAGSFITLVLEFIKSLQKKKFKD